MKPTRLSPVHCRCTAKKACGRRFKAHPGDACPHCRAPCRLDRWAQARSQFRDDYCDCSGMVYMPHEEFTRHRRGSAGCVHGQPVLELPGIKLEVEL